MALFYQPLINGGVTADGTRIMKPETIEFATKVRARPHHIDEALKYIDPNLNVNTNRALGVVVAGDDGNAFYRGFGRTCSRRGLRSRRRRRPDRLGRPRDRHQRRLLHQRLRRRDGPGPPRHRDRQPGRELPGVTVCTDR